MLTWQKLEQSVRDTIGPLKGRKREQAAFVITALCFSGGYALGGKVLPDFTESLKWIGWVQIALYGVGAIALLYAVIRIWRLVHPAELAPVQDRPSAIKGRWLSLKLMASCFVSWGVKANCKSSWG